MSTSKNAKRKATKNNKSAIVVARKQPAPSRNKNQTKMKKPALVLSASASDYAMAIMDPFDGPISGIPGAYPPLPSLKTRYWAKGSFTIGTGGVGFVLFNPFLGMAHSTSSLYYTSSTYAGTTFAVSGTGVNAGNTNAMFAPTNFNGTDLQGRVVAAGVSAQPTMAEVDLNGYYVLHRSTDNQTLSGYSESTCLAHPSAARIIVDSKRTPVHVHYIPVNPDEIDYTQSIPGSYSGRYCLGIMATGTPGKTFTYTVAVVNELIGQYAKGLSPSVVDPDGFAAVLNATSDVGDVSIGSSVYSYAAKFAKAAGGYLAQLSNSAAAQQIAQGVARTAGEYLMHKAGLMGYGTSTTRSSAGPVVEELSAAGSGTRNHVVAHQYGRDANGRKFDIPAQTYRTSPGEGSSVGDIANYNELAVLKPELLAMRARDSEIHAIRKFVAENAPFASQLPADWTYNTEFQGAMYPAVCLVHQRTREQMIIIEANQFPQVYAVFVGDDYLPTDYITEFAGYQDAFYYCIAFGFNLYSKPSTPPPKPAAKRV